MRKKPGSSSKKAPRTPEQVAAARGAGRQPPYLRRVIAGREILVGLMLPPELLAWPPLMRLVQEQPRPGYRDAVGLRHVAWALVSEALGADAAWGHLMQRLSAAGLLRGDDPARPVVLRVGFPEAEQGRLGRKEAEATGSNNAPVGAGGSDAP